MKKPVRTGDIDWPQSRLKDVLQKEIGRLRDEPSIRRSLILDDMAMKIAGIQRHKGETDNSLFARLEHTPGFEQFREEVVSRVRFNLEPPAPPKELSFMDQLKKL